MNACGFDVWCYAVAAVPTWAWWALGGFAALFIIGVLWRLQDLLRAVYQVSGWPGIIASLGAVATLVAVVWPKKKRPVGTPHKDKPKRRRLFGRNR
jgi:hypothetical protein